MFCIRDIRVLKSVWIKSTTQGLVLIFEKYYMEKEAK